MNLSTQEPFIRFEGADGWIECKGWRGTLKASQRITHHARLQDVGELVGYLAQTSAVLGQRLGATLFQLPPNFKKDLPRLESFLAVLPKRWPVTIEFRQSGKRAR